MTKQGSTFTVVQRELGLLEALLADAHGNASYLGRPWAAAGYLRVAAKKAEALAALLDAVQDTDREREEKKPRSSWWPLRKNVLAGWTRSARIIPGWRR